jgi:hypothetical protein
MWSRAHPLQRRGNHAQQKPKSTTDRRLETCLLHRRILEVGKILQFQLVDHITVAGAPAQPQKDPPREGGHRAANFLTRFT